MIELAGTAAPSEPFVQLLPDAFERSGRGRPWVRESRPTKNTFCCQKFCQSARFVW
jgi:hypothetical protein